MRNFTLTLTLASLAVAGCGTKAGSGDDNPGYGFSENTGGFGYGAGGGLGASPSTLPGGGAGAPSFGGSVGTPPAYGGAPAYGGGGPVGGGPVGGGPAGSGGAPTIGGATPPGLGGQPPAAGGAAASGGAPGSGGSTYVAPPGAQVATISLTPFQIQPGAEDYMCQNYDNPFGGKDAAVQDIVTDMTTGAHHMHIFYGTNGLDDTPDSSRTLEPCSGIEFHPLLAASQTPHQEIAYEPDMASMLKGTTGVRMQIHILNTTTNTLTVNLTNKLTAVDPSTISKWVATIYYNNLWLSVPPGMSTSTTTCSIPSSFGPVTLIGAGSHMHSRGVNFVATTSTGAMLYQTTQWEEPQPAKVDPPVTLNPGDSLTWACTYQNNSTNTLMFGEHALTNEMCIFVGSFYSSPNGNMLECQSYTPTGQTGISAPAE